MSISLFMMYHYQTFLKVTRSQHTSTIWNAKFADNFIDKLVCIIVLTKDLLVSYICSFVDGCLSGVIRKHIPVNEFLVSPTFIDLRYMYALSIHVFLKDITYLKTNLCKQSRLNPRWAICYLPNLGGIKLRIGVIFWKAYWFTSFESVRPIWWGYLSNQEVRRHRVAIHHGYDTPYFDYIIKIATIFNRMFATCKEMNFLLEE